jgi:O-antigen ligase
MDFYTGSLQLIAQHPVFGFGTGSFEKEYKTWAEAGGLALTRVPNPHNEYLLVTQQLGLVGLAMLLYFWWIHWRSSRRLEYLPHAQALRGLVLTLVVGSLFNSLLLDAGEGKFYCVLAGILLSGWRPQSEGTV